MKKFFLSITAIAILSAAFTSCTVEKRVHQDGYHISWKHRHSAPSELTQTNEISLNEEVVVSSEQEVPQPNVHSVETISASSNESTELILPTKKSSFIQSKNDTIVPDQPKQQEEYFSNNYTNPLPTNELQDTKLADWALGLGIASISAPVWGVLLFLLLVGIVGGASTSTGIWAAIGLAILAGSALFLAVEILAITFAIRFLRLHGKDPNYRKYRSRAITGLILAGIYPALTVINIILAIVLAI
jgi:hypothetical protein